MSVRSSFCVVALAIAAAEAPSSCPRAPARLPIPTTQRTLPFVRRPDFVRPASAPICRLFTDRCGHCAVALCTVSRHAPVTGAPSLALRCARSQAPPPAARKILGGAANVPPVPPGAAQVCTPTHARLNLTGDGQGACLGRRQRLRRGAPAASLRYTNEHCYARTRARMHAPVLARSHTDTYARVAEIV